MNEPISILLFYKFIHSSNPEQWKKQHLLFCKQLGIKGKVLIAEEGINGSVSGTQEQMNLYKQELCSDPRFADIQFKEEQGMHHPFNKMIVRVKKEIIRLEKEVDLEQRGTYVTPKEFLDLYMSNEEVIILDTRNTYESTVGKFKNAVVAPIETFREFPAFVDTMADKKNAKIVMYCTGGIRCEKASAYMKQQGFKNVSQLHGGIITFCQQFPNTVWEGSCFVFDKRLTSRIGQDTSPISPCAHCNQLCDLYTNCKNLECNTLLSLCPTCTQHYHSCCSQACMKKLLAC